MRDPDEMRVWDPEAKEWVPLSVMAERRRERRQQ
jgi:hypothetical protein